MNDLITDVKNLELETLQNLKSSKASNTLRAYKQIIKTSLDFVIRMVLNQRHQSQKL